MRKLLAVSVLALTAISSQAQNQSDLWVQVDSVFIDGVLSTWYLDKSTVSVVEALKGQPQQHGRFKMVQITEGTDPVVEVTDKYILSSDCARLYGSLNTFDLAGTFEFRAIVDLENSISVSDKLAEVLCSGVPTNLPPFVK